MIKSALLSSIMSITPTGVNINAPSLTLIPPEKSFSHVNILEGKEHSVCQKFSKAYTESLYASDNRKPYEIRRKPKLFSTLQDNGFVRVQPEPLPPSKFNRFSIYKPFDHDAQIVIVTELIEPLAIDKVYFAHKDSNLDSVINEASKNKDRYVRWGALTQNFTIEGLSEEPIYQSLTHDQSYDPNFIWKHGNEVFVFDARFNVNTPYVTLRSINKNGTLKPQCKVSTLTESTELSKLEMAFKHHQRIKRPLSTYNYSDSSPHVFNQYVLTNPWRSYPQSARQLEHNKKIPKEIRRIIY